MKQPNKNQTSIHFLAMLGLYVLFILGVLKLCEILVFLGKILG